MVSALRAAVVAAAVVGVARGQVDVPQVTFPELVGGADGSLDGIRRALSEHGLLAVTQVPGMRQLRAQAFADAAACVPASDKATRVKLADGTERTSLGAKTEHAVLGKIDAGGSEACRGFARSSMLLRKAVQQASHALVARLDAVCGTEDVELTTAEDGKPVTGVAQLLREGFSLEHFHVYSKTTRLNAGKAERQLDSLELHTDSGLMIAFVPALLVGSQDQDTGFLLEDAAGRAIKPRFPDEGNVLVFMVGEAFAQLVNPRARTPLRPAAHKVRVPEGAAARAWFGRMFLPGADVRLPSNETFAAVRSEQIAAASAEAVHTSAGCSSSALLQSRDLASSCPDDGDVFCWFSCVKPEEFGGPCEAGTVPKCVHPDKHIWTPSDGHCTSCSVQCLANKTAPSGGMGNGFCNGFGASMFMEGFSGLGNAEQACLVLFVDTLTLDSPVRFFLGVLAVFGLGLGVEGLVWLRRKTEREVRLAKDDSKRPSRVRRALLYFAQLVGAYLAMLVTMTYSVHLFVAVILGLVVGHALFNMEQPVSSFAEPCCAAVDDDADYSPLMTATADDHAR